MNRRKFLAASASLAALPLVAAVPVAAATAKADPLAGIDYDELEFCSTRKPPPGIDRTRILRCAWTDRYRLANALLGVLDDSQSVRLSRPGEHPQYPEYFAREIAIEGSGYRAQVIWEAHRDGGISCRTTGDAFTHAILTVKYAKPEFIHGMGA